MQGSDATGNAKPLFLSVTGWMGAFLSALLDDMELEMFMFSDEVLGGFSKIAVLEMKSLRLDIFVPASSFAVVNGLERSLVS